VRDTVLEGRFRLTEPLGSGGMGEVWAALDERMHREVAIKLVQELPGIGGRETALRFQREVRSAGSLSHRNIVTVHDWGEATVDGHRTLFMLKAPPPEGGGAFNERISTPSAASSTGP
jgi:serine/threonine protein kinase